MRGNLELGTHLLQLSLDRHLRATTEHRKDIARIERRETDTT